METHGCVSILDKTVQFYQEFSIEASSAGVLPGEGPVQPVLSVGGGVDHGGGKAARLGKRISMCWGSLWVLSRRERPIFRGPPDTAGLAPGTGCRNRYKARFVPKGEKGGKLSDATKSWLHILRTKQSFSNFSQNINGVGKKQSTKGSDFRTPFPEIRTFCRRDRYSIPYSFSLP